MDVGTFIAEYPATDDPDFISKISHKKEFYDLRLGPEEAIPKEPGELLRSQRFIRNFVSPQTPYQSVLLYHKPGGGKTCAASAVVENFKTSEVDGEPRPPALVLVLSDELTRTFSHEVATVCTRDLYIPRLTREEERRGNDVRNLSEETRSRRVSTAISRTYEIKTYETFLKSLPDDAILERNYSNRVIVVDEAHAIRIQPKKKKASRGLTSLLEEEEAPREVARMLYRELHRFLHAVKGCRILLLTGTPIWDRAAEIASLMNLILPLDRQLPTGTEFDRWAFDEEGKLKSDAEATLALAFRGRVSYLRGVMTSARREEVGQTRPWLKYVTIFPDVMSPVQTAASDLAAKEVTTLASRPKKSGEEGPKRTVVGGTVLKTARDAMNLVLPVAEGEVEYGPESFLKRITKTETYRKGNQILSRKVYRIDSPFTRRALTEDLGTYSTKFNAIIENLKANPKEVAFIYNEEVTGLGGAIMLGLVLELHGFRWIRTARDVERLDYNQRRFVVITSNPYTTNHPRQIQELLRSVNRPDNRYGDRLQIIIGSEKIAQGITIKHVRQEHIIMPHWNLPSTDQARARGFRFGSHDAFSDPAERYIKIYNHAAVRTSAAAYNPKAEPTTDIHIYRIAEEKEFRNTQIYRVLKTMAFDCALFYHRNRLETDHDGSRDCDFRECDYSCDGIAPIPLDGLPEGEIDFSTYVLHYGAPEVKRLVADIVKLFRSYFSLLVDVAAALLNVPPEEHILFLRAVDVVISSRILIRNRYGFGCYLAEGGNVLYLISTEDLRDTKYEELTYVENPLVVRRTDMATLVERAELRDDQARVLDFCERPAATKVKSISHASRMVMFETIWALQRSEGLNAKQQKVYDAIVPAIREDVYELRDGSTVHLLATEEFKGTSYALTGKEIKPTGKMRRLPRGATKWETVTDPIQEERYIDEIRGARKAITEERAVENPYGIYGTISAKDQSFRIVSTDGGKGKVCGSHKIPELVEILHNVLEDLPKPTAALLRSSKEELIENIRGRVGFDEYKSDLESKDVEYLASLLTAITASKAALCKMIREKLEERGLVYR